MKAIPLLMLLCAGTVLAQGRGQPIIDMHFHAVPVNSQGTPPVFACAPTPFAAWDARKPYPEHFQSLPKTSACKDPFTSPITDEQLLASSIAALEKHNIVAVASGPAPLVKRFKDASPSRILSGLTWSSPTGVTATTLENVRALHREGRLDVLGEISTQYFGIAPDDARLDALWQLAVELDVPVGIHIGPGAPGAIYLGVQAYRAKLHSALSMEEVLVRHPKLRVYIMHAGWPMGEDLFAVLYAHPQVYVDVSFINWMLPRKEFHRYLQRMVEAGFGDRIMYGSDQMVWPKLIERSIDAITDARFLSAAQKRDIFYNNAARFLRLPTETIAAHHRR